MNDRVLQVSVILKGHENIIIAAYLHTENGNDTEEDVFYQIPTKLIDDMTYSKEIILWRDLSRQIDSRGDNEVVGHHRENVTNNYGERLINVASTL